MATITYPRFENIDTLKAAVSNSGSYFFDRDALRFFSSRVSTELFGGRFFVTSEQDFDGPRRYTVRFVRRTMADNGAVRMTVTRASHFQEFSTLSEAKRFARRTAKRVDDSATGESPLTYDKDAGYLNAPEYIAT